MNRNGIVMAVAGLTLAFGPICYGTNIVANGGFESGSFLAWNISGSFACVGASVCGGNSSIPLLILVHTAAPTQHTSAVAAPFLVAAILWKTF